MYGLYNWYDKIKRYFRFKKSELIGLFFTILIIAFIFGLDDKRTTSAIDAFWWKNLLSMFLIVALTVILHVSAQKIYGLKLGFRVEYKAWYYGLIASLILVLVFKASIIILLPGGILIHHMAKHRLGYWRYGRNMGALSAIAVAGPLISIFIAIIFRLISFAQPNNVLIDAVVMINVWYAIFTILPIPPLDGAKAFFGNMYAYFFIVGFIIAAAVLLLIFRSPLLNLFLSLIVGLVVLIVLSVIWKKVAGE